MAKMNNDRRKMKHRHISCSYTRTEYIKRIPQGKEAAMKWCYGDVNKLYQHELHLVSTNEKLISINSLDAVRIYLGHALGDVIGYYMRIHPYPHEILREHGLLGVNKAERLCKGMKKSFGKCCSKVAHVRPNQLLITLKVNDNLLDNAKEFLDTASKKLSCSCRVEGK